MNRPFFGMAAMIGLAIGALAAVVWQRSSESNGSAERYDNRKSGNRGFDGVERITAGDGGIPPSAAAVSERPNAEEQDPLHGSGHDLPPDQAEHVRAASRLIRGGKATSSERERMYDDSDNATVSGSMSDTLGREDHNPIGRR